MSCILWTSKWMSKRWAAEMRSLEIQDWRRAAQHWSSFSVWKHFHLHSTHGRGNLLFRQRPPPPPLSRVSELLCLWCHHSKRESSPRLIFFSLFIFLGTCTTIQKGNWMLLGFFCFCFFPEQIFYWWRCAVEGKVNSRDDQNDTMLAYFE